MSRFTAQNVISGKGPPALQAGIPILCENRAIHAVINKGDRAASGHFLTDATVQAIVGIAISIKVEGSGIDTTFHVGRKHIAQQAAFIVNIVSIGKSRTNTGTAQNQTTLLVGKSICRMAILIHHSGHFQRAGRIYSGRLQSAIRKQDKAPAGILSRSPIDDIIILYRMVGPSYSFTPFLKRTA